MAGEKQPFTGTHTANVRLSGSNSAKDTRHHEISLGGAPVTYLPGDALGLYPRNDVALVDRVIRALGARGDEPVPGSDGSSLSLGDALETIYDLNTPSRRLFELMVARGATDLAPLMDRANAERLRAYLNGWDEAHDVLDVLEEHPEIRLSATDFVGALRKMLPRLYSIASSLAAHPDQVDLLVVSVKYTIRRRERTGVCSTWLADRWPVGASAPMYVQNQQRHFGMPADHSTPMIMVGPGTGLAPFRAFIEERRAAGATGKNWLFFGEQHRATEFFYQDELLAYAHDGLLRLDLAFSRDQAQKIYVQHRMREHAADLWAWIDDGAEIFVCGDKDRMAADVDAELHRVIETEGGKTPDQAKEYVDQLKRSKRYKRDVY
jgi:sulfite reductase (NADPH) flavoprotein alpha-component